MRQLAVITPYAKFELRFLSVDESKRFAVRYARRADYMPPPPREVKHHPSSVDLIVLKKLIRCAQLRTPTLPVRRMRSILP